MPRDCSRLAAHSEISPHISAAWDKHLDWATIRESLVEGAAKAAKYGLPWDEPAHIKHLTSLWEYQRLLAVEKLKPRLVWSVQLTDILRLVWLESS